MAAPHVSGVAALIVGKFGHLPPAQIRAILEQSADDLYKPGADLFSGHGRVNAQRALGD
jgi:subtilisin family serine protease